ncbi:crotonase/enoyl-CoA hydratase family protein [Sediminicurvatus halobius]|uniref:Enoyl-CoA hydratase n=1 Tax=Sediminicurvatus halobius TaxID=2182432 RepID=A0A2U2MWF7_9GAMM|nr:crotonase/enoyl-CoA hydratase family protein [Spiribacter halobius]PWG61197.1 enoyl-CoA hydratase [Spiribacter halobius]UEX77935.1 crotonase/enoyl-CoA hydratase family protein [Spiribacter halobius]
MTEILLCERRDEIAILTLNRPERLNALSYALIDALMATLGELEGDDTVRGIVITGAGDRAFSAGADISEFQHSVRAGPGAAVREFCRRGQEFTRRLESYPKPIVAAINGLAYGGGCEISEAMAYTIAAEDALLCKSEIRLGLIPDFGGTQRLPRLVGRKHALDMVLTGDPITAQRATEIGLVNRVVPKSRVLEEAIGWLRRVTRHSALAVEAALTAVNRGVNVSIDEGLAIESAQFARLVPTQDLAEGIAAFLNKREPEFLGQ